MGVRFGEEVRSARTNQEVSLRKVADALGFAPAYISDIERGNRNPPAPAKVRLWASLIGLDPDELLRVAAMDRSTVELPIDGDPRRGELAFALAREWPQMTHAQQDELLEFLNKLDRS